MADKKTVAVIFGGQSTEHEVSRFSATSIINNINKDKYNVVMMGITKEGKWLPYDGPVELISTGEWVKAAASQCLEGTKQPADTRDFIENIAAVAIASESHSAENIAAGASPAAVRTITKSADASRKTGAGLRNIDVVFPVLHGKNGEDGTIQGMLELAGIPYVGPGVLASSVGMDKAYTKIIFEKAGIPQGDYYSFLRKDVEYRMDQLVEEIEKRFEYPCFIKPSNAGSSVGVSKAHDREELIRSLENAARYDRRILVEEFINGREIECAVLGNDDPIASTVGEVIPANEFYDYEAKYKDDNSKTIIPAQLPLQTIQEIREYAVKAFKSLDCAGLSRVDFFVHKETGKVYINEVNTIPGFTSISMYPKLWEASGIKYADLIERLIELAIERYEEKQDK